MVFSVQGPETSIKACRAMMSQPGSSFEILGNMQRGRTNAAKRPNHEPDGYRWFRPQLYPDKAGYEFYTHRLGYSTWHMLAVSRQPGVIPVMSETGLWRALRDPTITTPILRCWMTWLACALIDAELLHLLDSYRTNGAVLRATSTELDEIISKGLADGEIVIEKDAA